MTSAEDRRRAAIRPVKRRHEDTLLDLPGVVAVDIGAQTTNGVRTGRPAIVVSVRAKRPAIAVAHGQLLPERIDGVPVDVIEEDVLLHPALLRADAAPERTGESYAPLVGGISVGPCRSIQMVPPQAPEAGEYVTVGTLGLLVAARDDRRRVFGLTNFHIACVDDAWAVGDRMTHPSRVDGGRCPADVVGSLASSALSGSVDAALIALAADRPWRREIAQVGRPGGCGQALLGSQVRKRGRTTGLTRGVVVSTDVTLCLDYGDSLGHRRLRDQIRVTAAEDVFGDRGDSGAVLVDADNQVVGLHCAGTLGGGSGFANPINRVLEELDVVLA
ncbi:hypothetical protein N8J89_39375 [Crossiella sp. CA-258035]|uniref:hypothetical protein n=1 Tax=Crossiella sp. CA-258035 TaxID=2981138 RepID=UPI0024BC875D|nr:hypothetical protein [Crossiella sp. CA-258035]WHT19088.1 hypothetical protein N8J89_39375 [Crossiella sp. CA-258035]